MLSIPCHYTLNNKTMWELDPFDLGILRWYYASATENQIRFVPISTGELKCALSFTLRNESTVDCLVASSETGQYTQQS
jgi:hypothetical protein